MRSFAPKPTATEGGISNLRSEIVCRGENWDESRVTPHATCVPTLPKLTGTNGTNAFAQVDGCQRLLATGEICTGRRRNREAVHKSAGAERRRRPHESRVEYGVPSTGPERSCLTTVGGVYTGG